MLRQTRKVVIIGAGSVGTAYAYGLMQSGLANYIVIVDIDQERAEGEAMDLSHGVGFCPYVHIEHGDYDSCKDADLIVMTAGAKQKSGQSRLELVEKNVEIIQDVCGKVDSHTNESVMIMVTNPVDVLTYAAIKSLNWPSGRVIGSGTVLDTARFKYMLSEHCNVDARNVHAYILGEHGDSEIAAWSLCHIAGMSIAEYCPRCAKCNYTETRENIAQRVKDSAYHIIDYKGATCWGIGLSLVRISEAILRDENSVLTVSTLLDGQYGISDVCLSVPCVVGKEGVSAVIEAQLPEHEQEGLMKSAEILKDMLDPVRKKL